MRQLRALGRSSPHPAGRPRALRVCGSRLSPGSRLLTAAPSLRDPSLAAVLQRVGSLRGLTGWRGVHGLAGGGERSPALQLVACTHYLPRPAVAPRPPVLWSIVAPGDNTHVMYTRYRQHHIQPSGRCRPFSTPTSSSPPIRLN